MQREESVGVCQHVGKGARESVLWLLFLYVFFLPLGLPCVNWASQECYLFYAIAREVTLQNQEGLGGVAV